MKSKFKLDYFMEIVARDSIVSNSKDLHLCFGGQGGAEGKSTCGGAAQGGSTHGGAAEGNRM